MARPTRSIAEEPAVLFDVDGTLVDSTSTMWSPGIARFSTWTRRCPAGGSWASSADPAPNSSKSCLATRWPTTVGDQVKKLHTRYFLESRSTLRRLPGARELLETVADKEWRAVLATSAGEEELAVLRDVLDAED
ncbi:HAD family hydrolase [Mycolicibacterium vaccae]|nr:HAD family hydrolase [Mycolicibacterium vaccae]